MYYKCRFWFGPRNSKQAAYDQLHWKCHHCSDRNAMTIRLSLVELNEMHGLRALQHKLDTELNNYTRCKGFCKSMFANRLAIRSYLLKVISNVWCDFIVMIHILNTAWERCKESEKGNFFHFACQREENWILPFSHFHGVVCWK